MKNQLIFYPPDLKKDQLNVLLELLTKDDIQKILHGAEALDMPYLFKNIFTTTNLRIKFCNNSGLALSIAFLKSLPCITTPSSSIGVNS